MSRVLVSLEGRITGRGLDVDAQFPEDPIMVWGDPDAVTQVCYNLLDNAAKFAAQGTDITVQITKKDGKALVTVRNLGATIPLDELPLLFERFHKADYSRSVDPGGCGPGPIYRQNHFGQFEGKYHRHQRGWGDSVHLHPDAGVTAG